jgi:hypothetical protein
MVASEARKKWAGSVARASLLGMLALESLNPRINHTLSYSTDDACTIQAESFSPGCVARKSERPIISLART